MCTTSMRQVLDNHAPLKTRRVPVRPSDPWISEEIFEVKRALRRAEKLANCSRLTVHREIFVKRRNLLEGLHRSARKEHYCNKLTDCTSAKLIYGVTDDLFGGKKTNHSCLSIFLLLTFQTLLPAPCTTKLLIFAEKSMLVLYL